MSDTLETTPHGATDAEHDAHGPAGHHGYIGDKQRYLNRLKRIEGQARGIRSMVEDEKYCIDILTGSVPPPPRWSLSRSAFSKTTCAIASWMPRGRATSRPRRRSAKPRQPSPALCADARWRHSPVRLPPAAIHPFGCHRLSLAGDGCCSL